MKDPRELDDRYLPRAAQRVASAADALAARRERILTASSSVNVTNLKSLKNLKALDAKYAGSGPLAFLRDVPQLGFVVIGLVFLLGMGTVVTREAANNRRADQQTIDVLSPETTLPGSEGESTDDGNRTLGPEVGTVVQTYLGIAGRNLASATRSSGGTKRVALVSFRTYLTPGQLKQVLGGYQVDRIYLRSRAGGKDAAQLPVDVRGDLAATLPKAFAQAAHGRDVAHNAYQGYVDTLTVVTKEDQAFKDLYVAFARSTTREARAYRSSCACGYAAVVTATPTRLTELAKKQAVRGIQVANKGLALRDLQVLPLLPEVTKVVPQQQATEEPP